MVIVDGCIADGAAVLLIGQLMQPRIEAVDVLDGQIVPRFDATEVYQAVAQRAIVLHGAGGQLHDVELFADPVDECLVVDCFGRYPHLQAQFGQVQRFARFHVGVYVVHHADVDYADALVELFGIRAVGHGSGHPLATTHAHACTDVVRMAVDGDAYLYGCRVGARCYLAAVKYQFCCYHCGF